MLGSGRVVSAGSSIAWTYASLVAVLWIAP
jgi:hypothetical protein